MTMFPKTKEVAITGREKMRVKKDIIHCKSGGRVQEGHVPPAAVP